MADTVTCPTCQQLTSAEYNFCLHCKSQTKCLKSDCGHLLVTGMDICLFCGEPIKAMTAQSQTNRLRRIIKPTKYGDAEDIDFQFSDHVATELAPFISGQMPGRQPQQRPISIRTANIPPALAQQVLEESIGEQETINGQQEDTTPTQAPTTNLAQGAARFFRRDGDFLLLDTKDFKGTNWADQQRRFILLYAYAYEELLAKPVANKDHFKAAAEKASINDKNNFSRYLNDYISRYILETSTGLALNNDGKQEVLRIIGEMDNAQVPAGFQYANKSQSESTKRSFLNDKDKERLHTWAQEDVALGQLDFLSITTGRDYALLAFWLLITHLKKGDRFRWNEAYEFLKAKYKAISASSETFSKAVKSPHNTHYFRVSDEAFFLSPEANTKVEAWVAGTSKPGTNETESEK